MCETKYYIDCVKCGLVEVDSELIANHTSTCPVCGCFSRRALGKVPDLTLSVKGPNLDSYTAMLGALALMNDGVLTIPSSYLYRVKGIVLHVQGDNIIVYVNENS